MSESESNPVGIALTLLPIVRELLDLFGKWQPGDVRPTDAEITAALNARIDARTAWSLQLAARRLAEGHAGE